MSQTRTVLSVFGLAPIRIGGMEIFAHELSRQLAEKDWHSVLCFLRNPDSDDVRRFLELPNVTLETLNDPCVPSLAVLRGMVRILAKHKPEILHLHFTPNVSPYPWLARLAGVKKVIITDHSSHPVGWTASKHPVWKRALSRAINAPLTSVVCVSEFKRSCLIAKGGLSAHQISCVCNGVNISRAAKGEKYAEQFRRRHAISQDSIVFMQVGWMIPEKGFVELLHAGKLAINRNPNIHLVLVGDGPCLQEYIRLAESLGIGDHVTFTGLVQDPLAEGTFAAADIVCQLSQWEEAFGFTIAEAMASGKPMIASRVGGIPEVVLDGVSGFLVDRGDVTTTTERMLLLAADRDRRILMGRIGQHACKEKFDVKKNVSKLLQFYDLPEKSRNADLPLESKISVGRAD